MNFLKDKTVLLTGASGGLGKELTKILITKYNCNVVGVNRSADKLEEFKQQLGEHGKNFSYYSMDTSIAENWQNLYKTLTQQNITINLLINNAGVMPPFIPASKIDLKTFERVINVNFYSAVYSYNAFLPMLKNQTNAGIVNISSAAALCIIPGVSSYAASKAALSAYSQTIAIEHRKKIFVGTYHPGLIKTNLFYSKDNSKDVIRDNSKLINFLSKPADKVAKKIIRKIKHKRRRSLIGLDSKLLNVFYKIFPRSSGTLINKIFKASKYKTFEELFND